MQKLLKHIAFWTVAVALPMVALAQPPGDITDNGYTLWGLFDDVAETVLQVTWVVASAFVIIAFVLGGFKYLTAHGDPSKVSDANKALIWGAAGAMIVIIAWSIEGLIRAHFGV